jgi:predicted nucleic acid-binding protein
VIVLDTNVISELMRPQPNAAVVAWIAVQPGATLCTTSINKAEILYGIAALPHGRRRTGLLATAEAIFDEDLADRVLPFDGAAAARYAEIVTARNRAGRRIDSFDALIAATALAAGAAIATRDVSGFEGIGLTLIDPWAQRG